MVKHFGDERLIVPMFHPAAALHQPSLKNSIIEDFRKLPDAIQAAKSAGEDHRFDDSRKR
jgi:DNA polymerase